jgi:YVTN family beta-propeller protein
MRRIALLGLLIASVAVLAPTAVAAANTFPVTDNGDSGPGTLRQAIEEANANPGADAIPIGAIAPIEPQTELPTITGPLNLTGPGPGALVVRRSVAAPPFRIFTINAGATPVSISGMAIEDGKAHVGGGISVVGSSSLTLTRVVVASNEATGFGGGIAVESLGGPLTLRESLILGNIVRNPSEGFGGGVSAQHGGMIERSSIISNAVEVPNPTGKVEASGGGVFFGERSGGGPSEIRQSTITGNGIVVGPGATDQTLQGAGAFVENIRIVGSTITANSTIASSPGQGANLFSANGTTSVADTILSGAQGGPSCTGAVASEGFNIDDGTSCGLSQPTDLSPVDPLLAPGPTDNGGPTFNFALLPGSPAIDHGKAFGATTDQRGRPRPSDFPTIANAAGGDGSDIGAVEFQALPPAPLPPARLLLTGEESIFPTLATIKTQGNELIGEPLRLKGAAFGRTLAIAATPDGKRAYIANEEEDNVSVIDTTTNTELAGSPIALRNSFQPKDIAITPDGTRAYIVNDGSDNVSVIDTATNTELAGSPIVLPTQPAHPTPAPTAIAISPDGKRAYVADSNSDLLYVIDTQTNAPIGQPISLKSGSVLFPTAIAISPDGKRAYVANSNAGEVIVVDTQTNQASPTTIGVGGDPLAIAISPDGTRAYVANRNSNDVSVIDTQTNRVLTSIQVGLDPSAIAITPDGARAYVADQGAHDVSVIDTKANQVLAGTPIEMSATFRPSNLTITPDQGPIAFFNVPPRLRLGAPLRPDASASHDPDGTVTAFNWDFGDGAKATGQSPQHPYAALGTYNLTLTVADGEGCSTSQVFTGKTVSCNGSAAAKVSRSVKVVLPAVRVSCPAKARRRGCRVKLQVVSRKRHGRAETKLAKAKLRAGKSKLISLRPRRAFIATLGSAKRALVRETVKIGRLRHTTVRRLAIR